MWPSHLHLSEPYCQETVVLDPRVVSVVVPPAVDLAQLRTELYEKFHMEFHIVPPPLQMMLQTVNGFVRQANQEKKEFLAIALTRDPRQL